MVMSYPYMGMWASRKFWPKKRFTVVKANQIRKNRSSFGESFYSVRGSRLLNLPYRITCGSKTREIPCFIFYTAHLKQFFLFTCVKYVNTSRPVGRVSQKVEINENLIAESSFLIRTDQRKLCLNWKKLKRFRDTSNCLRADALQCWLAVR